MAAITIGAEQESEPIRKRLKVFLARLHGMLDAFVSDRMRQAVAQAGRTSPTAVNRRGSMGLTHI